MEYLSASDLSKLFRAFHSTESERHHQCALLLFFSGCRISQALALKGADVFQLDGKWVVKIGAAKRGHSGVRTVQISTDPAFSMEPLIEMAQRAGSSKLFGSLDRFYFDKVMKRCGAKCGMPPDFLHAHVLRHSISMMIFAQTQRIGCVSEFLLHKSPASAFSYLRENDSLIAQDAVNVLQLGT